MPYRSAAQRRFMHAKKPEIAAEWDKKYGGAIQRRLKKTNEKKIREKGSPGNKMEYKEKY